MACRREYNSDIIEHIICTHIKPLTLMSKEKNMYVFENLSKNLDFIL